MSGSVYKPMRGWGTGDGDGPPILAYDSDNPVRMLSPCPCEQFEIEKEDQWYLTNGGALSYPDKMSIRVTADATTALHLSSFGVAIVGKIRMLYEGVQQYTLSLSWYTAAADVAGAVTSTLLYIPGASLKNIRSEYSGGVLSEDTITVPYYRWYVTGGQVQMTRAASPSPYFQVGDWVQLTLEPVVT